MKRMGVLLLMLGAASLAANDVEFPLVQSFSYFPFSQNVVLKPGQFSLGLFSTYTNIFNFNTAKTIITDMEIFGNTFSLSYGLSNRLCAELDFKFFSIHGGFLDGVIVGFHKLFGYPTAGRNQFPAHSVLYRYGSQFYYSQHRIFFSPLVLGLLAQLYETGPLSMKIRVAGGIPLMSEPGLGSEKPFFAAGVVLGYAGTGLSFEISNHVSWIQRPEWAQKEDIAARIHLLEIKAEIGRFICSFLMKSSPFETGDISHTGYMVFLGYLIKRGFEIGITEDFDPYDTTPDFSLYFKFKLF